MGVYVEYLRGPKHFQTIIHEGKEVVIGCLSYLARLNDFNVDDWEDKTDKFRAAGYRARADKALREWGKNLPEFMVRGLYYAKESRGKKFFKEEGAEVYRVDPNAEVYYDCDCYERIGVLRRKPTGEWYIAPEPKCWSCYDTGRTSPFVKKIGASTPLWPESEGGPGVFYKGDLCECQPGGREAAQARYKAEEAVRVAAAQAKAKKDAEAALRVAQALGLGASLNSAGL